MISAAGEVKASLDVAALDDCIKKGTAFKQLRMTLDKSDHVMTVKDQRRDGRLTPPDLIVTDERDVVATTAMFGAVSCPSRLITLRMN